MIKKIKLETKLLCDIANVSPSGYYRWKVHSNERDKDYDDYLLIKNVFDKGRGKYGFRTIQMNLKIKMNHKKIIRIKNKYGLITKIRRINPYKGIMKKSIEHRTFKNILDREFKQDTHLLKHSVQILPIYLLIVV